MSALIYNCLHFIFLFVLLSVLFSSVISLFGCFFLSFLPSFVSSSFFFFFFLSFSLSLSFILPLFLAFFPQLYHLPFLAHPFSVPYPYYFVMFPSFPFPLYSIHSFLPLSWMKGVIAPLKRLLCF